MSSRTTKHTAEERLVIVRSIVHEKRVLTQVAKEEEIDKSTIMKWIHRYETEGAAGLQQRKTNHTYSPELKMQAVKAYLDGQGSYRSLCKKYQISADGLLKEWVKAYHKGQLGTTKRRETLPMKKGRSTTQSERIEIAQYAIAHEHAYQQTAEKFEVSYQQVYQWVHRYKKNGPAGLEDRRGKALATKPILTEREKMRLRIQELEHRNEYLEQERGVLKKLKDIERGHRRG